MTATSEQELLLIGETWAPAIAGSVRDVLDPASGEVIAQVADASRADVDGAVAQARAVFDGGAWPGMPGAQRARILWRVADLIEEHADELARLETRDQGQPLSISAGFSVPMAAEVFRYYAGWCTKIESTAGPVTTPDVLHYTRREPVGVTALITPWNFPLMMALASTSPQPPLRPVPPRHGRGGTAHDHQMVHGCDALETDHEPMVAKRAIKIRNGSWRLGLVNRVWQPMRVCRRNESGTAS